VDGYPVEGTGWNDQTFWEEEVMLGKNLFKYDPSHFEPGVVSRLAILWVEDQLEPYYQDQW
jgi:hypothetical protein